ncbi:MAG TPA: patatin-like phospholipase family protein, partial [Alphaproteobacteria bacterium]|nr:patatin-like phospholipase family protein [Alphaproteobacteria bacterium]
ISLDWDVLERVRAHERDVLLASACLPFMFQAIEIDGEYYWDGGYMGNPAIYPLIYHCESQDVVICQINPLYREDVPRKARDILDRVNEISFNSSLMREMRVVAFVTKLLDEGHLSEESYKRMYVHMIEDDKEMKLMGASSKLCADQAFLLKLKNLGRRAADRWLRAHFDDLGQKSTIDIHDVYM